MSQPRQLLFRACVRLRRCERASQPQSHFSHSFSCCCCTAAAAASAALPHCCECLCLVKVKLNPRLGGKINEKTSTENDVDGDEHRRSGDERTRRTWREREKWKKASEQQKPRWVKNMSFPFSPTPHRRREGEREGGGESRGNI